MRFAVSTFQRVFDTEPNRDVVALQRLIGGLTRFLVRPKAQALVDRELQRLDNAWRAWQNGAYQSGKYWTRLSRARKKAQVEGVDSEIAAEKERVHLEKDIRSMAKKDLRLWSPTHYPDQSRRGSDQVLHLSCLVLDYDSGVRPSEAEATWEGYFHILHTTWSHTPQHPKFRLILPLATPVPAAHWPQVYAWAQAQTGFAVDGSKKGAGTTFALPAVPDPNCPRLAFSSPGPLLDPVIEGLVDTPAPPAESGVEPHGPNHFRIAIPGHTCVQGSQVAAQPHSAPQVIKTTATAAVVDPKPTPPSKESADTTDDPWDDSEFPWN